MPRGLGRWAGRRDDSEKIAAGIGQCNGGRSELAAARRSHADQLEQLDAGAGTHDRLVGRAQRREHPCQAFLLFVSPGLFVGAIEIIECEPDILREALQERDQFGLNVLISLERNTIAPIGLPSFSSGKAAPDRVPLSRTSS